MLLGACGKPQAAGDANAPHSAASGATPEEAASAAAAAREARKLDETPTYDETAKAITAKVGSRFAIVLQAKLTMPMKWRIDPDPDPSVLRKTGESYTDLPPAECQGCAGYAGTRRFTFEAKQPGKLSLHFAYRPLSEPQGRSEREVSFEITLTE